MPDRTRVCRPSPGRTFGGPCKAQSGRHLLECELRFLVRGSRVVQLEGLAQSERGLETETYGTSFVRSVAISQVVDCAAGCVTGVDTCRRLFTSLLEGRGQLRGVYGIW